jgi:hypothetical protein
MFSIVVNGQQVDHSGITVNLYLKSTFPFSPDQGQIEGSFAFNGSLPASPLNKRIFGFPHRLEGVFDLPSNIPCQLTINGRLWYDALISITSSTETIFNFDLLFGYGGFASLIEGKTLKDLAFPDPVSTGDDQEAVIAFAEDIITKSYPETGFNFPMIYNPDFYGDANPEFLWFMNHYNSGAFMPNIYSSNGVRNFNTLVPMLYLHYVTKLCFETFGYKPTGSFFDDPDLAKALLYNNCALDEMRKKYLVRAYQANSQEFPPMGAKILFSDDSTPPNEDQQEVFDTTASEYEIAFAGAYTVALSFKFWNKLDDPMKLKVKLYCDEDVIETITLNETTLWQWVSREVFFEKYFEDDSIGKKLSIRIYCEDIYGGDLCNFYIKQASIVFENTSLTDLNVYSKILDFYNHVPEKEISAFLVNLQLLFGLIIGFDHEKKTAELSFVRDSLNFTEADNLSELTRFSSKKVILEPSEGYNIQFDFDTSDQTTEMIFESVDLSQFIGQFNTFNDLPWPSALNDVAYIKNTNSYYIYNVVAGPGPYWNHLAHYHPIRSIGQAKNEVRPEMSPLMTHMLPGNRNVYATILQEGTSFAYPDKVNECGLRILFYHGLCPMVNSENLYPFGSSLSYDSLGNSVGGIDLVLHGSKSIYDIFLEYYYTWLNNIIKKVTFSSRMTFSKLKLLDLRRLYRIFNARFLIYEAKVSVTEDTMAEVELDCRKV